MKLAEFISDFKKFSDREESTLTELFNIVITELKETNKVMNLTTIIEDEDIIEKHFYDSALILKSFDIKNKSFLDVGTGGGFPGIVLAILNSKINVTLLDSNQKKISYLDCLIKKLEINNAKIVCGRIEEKIVKDESFDVVSCRAVTSLSMFCEISSYAVKIGGDIICYKSQKYEDEILEAKNAFDLLKLSKPKVYKDLLPSNKEMRAFIDIKKLNKTPNKYPRNFSQISKKPL